VFAVLAVAVCAPVVCVAQVTSNVLLRTLLIAIPGTKWVPTGTAFTIDVDGRQYLVTAKHDPVAFFETESLS